MWALAALALLVSPLVAQDAQSFDLVIRGGRIVDGTGNPWVRAGETGSLETAPTTATQSCRCSHFGIARGLSPISSADSGDFSGHGRGAGEVSRAWGEVGAGVRVIVSRARFGGPGF